MDNSHLTKREMCLLLYYACVLPPGRDKLFSPDNIPGLVENFEVKVDIADTSPWQARLIPCSPGDKDAIDTIITSNLKLDLVEDCSGPYACAAILVRKKNGRHKLACCLNELNRRCRKNSYPVPLIRDNLDCLANRPFQTTIDVCGGYNSMVIKESDRDYFAFITHRGLFRWKRVPYGWRNAGAHFCYLMDKVLAGLKYQILILYVDDTNVYHGVNIYEHMVALRVVFNRFQTSGLTLSIAKCFFCVKKFDYLGFQVTRSGISPATHNIDKIMNCKCTSIADIKHFVGLAQYYRRWVQNFTQIVAPCYEAMKHTWLTVDHIALTDAIEVIKNILVTYPVLRHPDFDKPFFLATDGGPTGFGAVLKQKDDVVGLYSISYASSGVPASMKHLCGPQLEAAAAAWGMTNYRQYLIGRQFTLLTDQVVLKYLKYKTEPLRALAAPIIECQEVDYVFSTCSWDCASSA